MFDILGNILSFRILIFVYAYLSYDYSASSHYETYNASIKLNSGLKQAIKQ